MALGGRAGKPKNTLPLLTSAIKLDAEDAGLRCCFRRAGALAAAGWHRLALR